MGAFFYRFGPSPTSLYVKLAKRIKSSGWSGAIGTLNYDRMLLLAMNGQPFRLVKSDGDPAG